MRTVSQTAPWLALALVLVSQLSACNTWEGLGRDVQQTGEAIEDSTDENDMD